MCMIPTRLKFIREYLPFPVLTNFKKEKNKNKNRKKSKQNNQINKQQLEKNLNI